MTTNHGPKKRIRNLMKSAPQKMSYVEAKKLIDEHIEYADSKRDESPLNAAVPNAFELFTGKVFTDNTANIIADDADIEMLNRMAFATEEILFVGMERFEKESVEAKIERASAECHVNAFDVKDGELFGLSRALVHLVAEFEDIDALRKLFARVYVYVTTGYVIETPNVVETSSEYPDEANDALRVFNELSDAYVMQVAVMTLNKKSYDPRTGQYVGFGSMPSDEGTLLTADGQLYFGLTDDCESVDTSLVVKLAKTYGETMRNRTPLLTV